MAKTTKLMCAANKHKIDSGKQRYISDVVFSIDEKINEMIKNIDPDGNKVAAIRERLLS